jgi:PAS domain S-box-containing protein
MERQPEGTLAVPPRPNDPAERKSPTLENWSFHPGKLSTRPIRAAILSSWQRSSAAGLTRGAEVPFRRVGDPELAVRREENRELLEVTSPHLDWVTAFMQGVSHGVFLTDRDGIVLASAGDLVQAEELRLAAGHDRSERAIGTNATGLAIATDEPIAVVGPEHFAAVFEHCATAAAPIHHDGRVIGAIDIMTSVADATPERLALVAHIAFVIERELAALHEALQQQWYRQLADELRAREVQLLRTNAQLEALLDNTTAVIYLLDANARFLRINRRCEILFDLTNSSAVGRSLYELFPREDADRYVENNRRAFEASRPMEFEEEARVHGERRIFLSVKVPIFDSTGAPYAICGISTDITDRKVAEDRERQRLHEANERKERFIAALAHELRSPIAAIVSAAQVLGRCADDSARVKAATGIIDRQGTHIMNLIEQLLDSSRVATKRLVLKVSRLEIHRVLEQAIEAVRPGIEKRHQKLEVSLPRDAVFVEGDATRLTQVFVNLLGNASRYSDAGKTITLVAMRSSGEAIIGIRDEGCGIAPELIPRVFELMFQVSGERSSAGLGIGLALVQGIIDAHGGRVSAHSAGVGHGSEFVVRIPCLP